jgi:hypothetical protein
MAYASFTYSKLDPDFIIGIYTEATLAASIPVSGYITIAGSIPSGLTADVDTGILSGVADTGEEGDYDITVEVYDQDDILQDTITWTIVVLSLDIAIDAPMDSLTAYDDELGRTFTYSVTGPYTIDNPNLLIWEDLGSELFDDILLTTGTLETPSLSGEIKEVGDFLV